MCPSRDEWLHHTDGEVTANRAAELEAHAARCRACETARASVGTLIADLRVTSSDDDAMVARVMAGLDTARPAPARRWPYVVAPLALAAAFALVLLRPRDGDDVQARGGAPTLSHAAFVELFALGGEMHPLADGASVTPATSYVAAYRNTRAGARALVFAVDAAGDVHWLYPGYTDPASDPAAIALPVAPAQVLLPESVSLDNPAAGAMTVVIVVRERPMHVSDIEKVDRDARSPAALAARWPDAAIRTLRLDVTRSSASP